MIPDIEQYRKEKKIWQEAGKPLRSPKRIEELYNICKGCEHFQKITANFGQCKICTCFLRKYSTSKNKLAFATTRCPLEEPNWIEEENITNLVEEEPVQNIIQPRRGRPGAAPVNDCGCR
jgi:hypothetical protein